MTVAWTYLLLGIGAFAVAMGLVCMSFGLAMLFSGDTGGLFGCAIGAMNLALGILLIRNTTGDDDDQGT